MGKSIKRNGRRRIRKTRRRKLHLRSFKTPPSGAVMSDEDDADYALKMRKGVKGGSKTEAALYVWKDLDDKTLQKRIFVKQGINMGDSITDAGYQMRFFNGDFNDTIPRKTDEDAEGNPVIQNVNPYVKYLTADYSDGDVGETAEIGEVGIDNGYMPPPPPMTISANIDKTKLENALKDVKKDGLKQIAENLGILDEKARNKTRADRLIQLIVEELVRQ